MLIAGITTFPATVTAEDKDAELKTLLSSMKFYHFNKAEKAPDFILNALDGQIVQLSQMQDEVIMLGFWTTW